MEKFSHALFIGLGNNPNLSEVDEQRLKEISNDICFLIHRISLGFTVKILQYYLFYRKYGIEKLLDFMKDDSDIEIYIKDSKAWDIKLLEALDNEFLGLIGDARPEIGSLHIETIYYVFFSVAVNICKYLPPGNTKFIMDTSYELVFDTLLKEACQCGFLKDNSFIPPDDFFNQYAQSDNPCKIFAFKISSALKNEDLQFDISLTMPIGTINRVIDVFVKKIIKI